MYIKLNLNDCPSRNNHIYSYCITFNIDITNNNRYSFTNIHITSFKVIEGTFRWTALRHE